MLEKITLEKRRTLCHGGLHTSQLWLGLTGPMIGDLVFAGCFMLKWRS